MPQWHSDQLHINGTTIHYNRTGGDKPPLLLAHGYTDNGLCWTRVAQALEADYDIIMPDARGHGQSPNPDEPYNGDLHADDLAGLIEALDLGQPAAMGHSMGANNVSLLAARYPDHVSAAVLVDPPWRANTGPSDGGRGERWQTRKQDMIQRQRMSREALMAHCKQLNPTWHPIEVEAWVDAHLQFDIRTFDLFQVMPRPWQETAAAIRCPALLVTGDPDLGAIVTPEIAQEAVALAPTLQVAHIARAGHSIQREGFEAFIAAVQTFLKAQ